ncbi:MAG: uroporphyrinogen-III synthase [Rikenella sp.]|nr:uroporphyrinogen-III synthase [Rikenella sp.]
MVNTSKVKRILVSQPAPASDKSPFSDLISKHKVEIDFRPFITVEEVTVKEFRAQRIDVLAHTAVIFTSRKTIDSFFRLCEASRIQVPEDMKYFCVTEAIALYLQKYIVYRKRKIFYGKATFVDLMEVVAKHKDERFLVALSDSYKPEVLQLLTRTGVKFSKIILTHSVAADLSDIAIERYDMVACYGPADVRALHDTFSVLPEGMIVAALGNATAREALGAGMTVDIMAPTPKFPSLTAAMDKYMAALNGGASVEEFGVKELPEPAKATAGATATAAGAKKKSVKAKSVAAKTSASAASSAKPSRAAGASSSSSSSSAAK